MDNGGFVGRSRGAAVGEPAPYRMHHPPPSYSTGDMQMAEYMRAHAQGRPAPPRGRGGGFMRGGRGRGGFNFRDRQERRVCKFYAAGQCRFGDKCRNLHIDGNPPQREPRPCKFFAHGNCRFGDNCRNLHGDPQQ